MTADEQLTVQGFPIGATLLRSAAKHNHAQVLERLPIQAPGPTEKDVRRAMMGAATKGYSRLPVLHRLVNDRPDRWQWIPARG